MKKNIILVSLLLLFVQFSEQLPSKQIQSTENQNLIESLKNESNTIVPNYSKGYPYPIPKAQSDPANFFPFDLSCPEFCSGHGECVNGTCHCEEQYRGIKCETAICPNNCSGHGYCEEGVCSCFKGWTGDDCFTDSCPNHCSGNGKCFQGDCYCTKEWTSNDCSKPRYGIPGLSKPATFGYPATQRFNNTCLVIRVPPVLSNDGPKLLTTVVTVVLNESCVRKIIEKSGKVWKGWNQGDHGYNEKSVQNITSGDHLLCGIPEGCEKINVSVIYEGMKPILFVDGQTPASSSPSPSPPPSDHPIVLADNCPEKCSGNGVCRNFTITINEPKYSCDCEYPYIPPCCCTKDRNDTRPKKIDPLSETNPETVFNRVPCTRGDDCTKCSQTYDPTTSGWRNMTSQESCAWDSTQTQCVQITSGGQRQHLFVCRSLDLLAL